MSNGDVEFLIEAGLSDKVRHVCAGANVRCAVAFWGTGAAASLFPQGLEAATLVCDISMRGTPKAALLEMGAPANPKLLVRDGLHAKIYVSDRGAVIGSANASDNGLGLVPGASGRLVEAGIFCPVGLPAYHAAAAAVDRLIRAATTVNAEDVARAPDRSRELQPTLSAADLRRLPLLEAFQEAPSAFADLSVAVVSDDDLDEEKAEKVKHRYLASTEAWDDDDDIGAAFIQDNGDKAIETLKPNVLMFFMPKGVRSRWSAVLYTRTLLLPRKRPVFGFAFAGSHRATGNLRALIHGNKLSRADWDVLRSVSEQSPDTWAYTPEGFSNALARARSGAAK